MIYFLNAGQIRVLKTDRNNNQAQMEEIILSADENLTLIHSICEFLYTTEGKGYFNLSTKK